MGAGPPTGSDSAVPPAGVLQSLYTRFGLVPTGTQLGRIARAVIELQQSWLPTDPAALERAVLDSPFASIRPLVAAATINESYFFRDARQISVLREEILPSLIQRRRAVGDRRIVVWSAAAAAGQELHTIAILLHELLHDLSDWSVELIGTDIDADNLARAEGGLYSGRDLRSTPQDARERYFTPEGRGYRLSPEVRSMTRFITASITDPIAAAALGRVDLVLCRNVLIYFDADSIAQALRNMTGRLPPDGYLVLGHAEVFSEPPPGLTLDASRGMFFYRPASCPVTALSRPPKSRLPTSAPAVSRQPMPLRAVSRSATAQSAAGSRGASPSQRPRPPSPRRPEPPNPMSTSGEPATGSGDLASLLLEESWPELLAAAQREPVTTEARCYQVVALSALGRADDSAVVLADLLHDCADQAIVHYVAAIHAVDSGNADAAATSLRRALYLQRDFPEAEYRFGLVLEESGRSDQARVHFARAARLLAAADPDQSVLFEPDLRYGSLIAWLHAASRPTAAAATAEPERP